MFMINNDYLKTVRTHGTRMLVTLCVACCGSALLRRLRKPCLSQVW